MKTGKLVMNLETLESKDMPAFLNEVAAKEKDPQIRWGLIQCSLYIKIVKRLFEEKKTSEGVK